MENKRESNNTNFSLDLLYSNKMYNFYDNDLLILYYIRSYSNSTLNELLKWNNTYFMYSQNALIQSENIYKLAIVKQ